jgi:hypothetical protein
MQEGRGRRVAQRVLAEHGLSGPLGKGPAFGIEHVLSHRKLVVQLWRALDVEGEASETTAPCPLSTLGTRGLSSLTRKALALAGLARDERTPGLETPARSY